MKIKAFVLATALLSLPALAQDVDQAEVQKIIAAHPDYARVAIRSQAGPADPGGAENARLAIQCG